MAKKRRRFQDEHETPPTSGEANEKWRQFMRSLDGLNERLDRLDQSMAQLAELGQLTVMAVRDSAAYTGNPILGLFNKLFSKFQEVNEEYQEARSER